MSRSRLFIIIGAVLLLGIFGYAAFVFLNRDEATAPGVGATETFDELPDIAPPALVSSEIPQGETIALSGPKGVTTVRNFYTGAHQITPTDVIVTSTLRYDVIFSRTTNVFTLSLYPDSFEAFREYRSSAERDLLSALAVDATTACRLSIMVSVPESYQLSSGVGFSTSSAPSFCTSS